MSDEVILTRDGPLGQIELNRPRALNALTLGMIRAIAPVLSDWAGEDAVKAVVIKGAGDKAFCAGGDVRAVWQAHRDGDAALPAAFFREEYRLNRMIHRFPKPYIALIDGVTMGGGMGLSVHGSHRVASERSLLAMPETAIGLFPDVGAGWFLNRCPGKIGLYLALTGARLSGADILASGLATHFVPSDKFAALQALLRAADWDSGPAGAVADDAIDGLAIDPGPAPLAARAQVIDACFGADGVEAILAALEADGSDFARETAATLATRSPTSLKLAFAHLRRAHGKSLENVLVDDYRLSQACVAGHDYHEGVRAVLIDKDHAPKWRPASLAEVDGAMIEAHFRAPPAGDLTFD